MQLNSNVFKAVIVSGLAIGMSASVFAKNDNGSILGALKNSDAVKNIAKTIDSKKDNKGHGSSGGHSGGTTGGHGCMPPPPSCVPEPASMLARGAGAGFMAWKRRRAAKNAS